MDSSVRQGKVGLEVRALSLTPWQSLSSELNQSVTEQSPPEGIST